MTILDKIKNGNGKTENNEKSITNQKENVKDDGKGNKDAIADDSSSSSMLSKVESQFKEMMEEFYANRGFNVNTGEQPVDTMVEILAHPSVNVSLVLLLSYIRFCINHGVKKDITIKIGYNKPASLPMNFVVNEELLEDIYPGDVVEIN